MKKYYEIINADGYQYCHPIDFLDFDKIVLQLNGTSRVPTWDPIRCKIIHNNEGKKLKYSNSPWWGSHVLVFDKNAIDKMGEILLRHGELLPIVVEGGNNYQLYNVHQIINAIHSTSDLIKYKSGKIMMINKLILDRQKINNVDIFKLMGLRASPIIVSNVFIDQWNKVDLRGLEFKPLEAI